MLGLSAGDKIHIAETELSQNGVGIVQSVCRVSVTVRFDDSGKLGLYTMERNIPSIFPKPGED